MSNLKVNQARNLRKQYFDNRKKQIEDYKLGNSTTFIPNYKGIIMEIDKIASVGNGYVKLLGMNYQLLIDALRSDGFDTEKSGNDLIVKWDMMSGGNNVFNPVVIEDLDKKLNEQQTN